MSLRKHKRALPRHRVGIQPEALLRITAGVGTQHRVSRQGDTHGDPLLEGHCAFTELGFPLQLHAYDALELESARSTITLPAALSVAVILEGEVEAALDGQPLLMSAREGPAGYLWLRRGSAQLERRIRPGRRVRKVNITLPAHALGAILGGGEAGVLGEPGLGPAGWEPSAQVVRFAEEILASGGDGGPLRSLSGHIAARSILRSALSRLVEGDAVAVGPEVRTRDVDRARMARAFILEHLAHDLHTADIARHTGMSVSTLQRVFKACFDMTMMEFVRVRRLEVARSGLREGGLAVGEAAYRAGYSSPANFATAFQREFGYPPSSCIRVVGG